MSKFTFTVNRVSDIPTPSGRKQEFHWDDKTGGLGLRVTQSGSKSYIFQGSLNNKAIRITIGDIKNWSLKQAQSKANEYRVMIDQGIDPRRAARDQKEANDIADRRDKALAMTLRTVWNDYVKLNKNSWGDRHYRDHINSATAGGEKKKRGSGKTVAGPLASLLLTKLSNLDQSTVQRWIEKESVKRANKTRQAFEMLRACLRWANSRKEYLGLIDLNVVENSDVRKAIPKRKTKKFDVLEKSQLADWFTAVKTLSNPIIRVYLQALLLTGARREELAQLKWSDVDKNALWVKDKVDEEGRKIPLTPFLSQIIHSLPRKNEWVFSSTTSKTGHITEPRIAHNRALSSAGLPHVSLHGLRRSFASLAEWVEIPTGVIAQIMGHKPNATAEKHYKNRPIELLAVWHTKYEEWILEQANIDLPSKTLEPHLKVVG